ncbi:DUF1905 domain-containing protein [Nocardia huaxiensis]|uniref:DUF1905 domain-containing protein n=1 Tax=Nocardia huaxiensis TaxID=2755382 RepID=A0A7D6Z818_9NOCA|nr:DUF1905 domain-containing protein [Nocardia huaxiensis]QLY29288.1 DUF1905 domain-containing protein [Nocardia huaxiensis]UFS97237.1 DUF1905 domain-containing protein [Nocardia huaxiensis]
MPNPTYSFTARLWEWEGQAAWHFVSLPEDLADDIEELHGRHAAGFGSVRVRVTLGESRWSTSLFPDRKRATYILPIKKQVRTAEGLTAGDSAQITLTIA